MTLDISTFTCSFSVLLLITGLAHADEKWSYTGNYGPKNWHKLFPAACSGKFQSPIDIYPEETMYDPNLNDFAIWYDPPKPNAKMYVKNNGHAVQVDTEGDFFVTNGGLPNTYKTAQFHFHWGHANSHGSEHHVEGKAHPLELHIVNYDHDLYQDIAQAAVKPMGLAVLGVLFQITDEDNKKLKPIIEAIDEVKDPEENQRVEIKPMPLRDLLPQNTAKYYRYNGSLTTPGCFESVIWTVFEDKNSISLDQLLKFREVLQHRRHNHPRKMRRRRRKHHKRSNKERKEEHQAEKVLDELGINKEKFQKAELKAELLEKKMKEEKKSADVQTTTRGTTPELDEESAKRAEENMMAHILENKNGMSTDGDKPVIDIVPADENSDHGHNHRLEPTISYVQEHLVDNYRPIQKRNGRMIYRSFKLRQLYIPTEPEPASGYDANPPQNTKQGNTAQVKSPGNDASALIYSVATLLVAMSLGIQLYLS